MIATFEYIEQVIATCRRAASANEGTPARRGNVIVLTAEDGADVMITGDIHGHRRNFNLIHAWQRWTRTPSDISFCKKSAMVAPLIPQMRDACRIQSWRMWQN